MKNKTFILMSFFVLLLSCSNRNYEEDKNEDWNNFLCPHLPEVYYSPNFDFFAIKRDRDGSIFKEISLRITIWPFSSMGTLAFHFMDYGFLPTRDGIYAFEIEIPRSENREIREIIHQKMFRTSLNQNLPNYIVVNLWSHTVFPNETSFELAKTEVPFFIYKKTDSSYILSSLIISNDDLSEVLAGSPVFFIDYYERDFPINPEEFEEYGIIAMPVVFGGYCFWIRYSDWGEWVDTLPSVGILNAEFYSIDYRSGTLVESLTLLELPFWLRQRVR